MSENALEGTLGRTKISEYTTPPMNALITALPGLVIIFVLAGGVNALAGVLFYVRDRGGGGGRGPCPPNNFPVID